jgi:hypothetical protein
MRSLSSFRATLPAIAMLAAQVASAGAQRASPVAPDTSRLVTQTDTGPPAQRADSEAVDRTASELLLLGGAIGVRAGLSRSSGSHVSPGIEYFDGGAPTDLFHSALMGGMRFAPAGGNDETPLVGLGGPAGAVIDATLSSVWQWFVAPMVSWRGNNLWYSGWSNLSDWGYTPTWGVFAYSVAPTPPVYKNAWQPIVRYDRDDRGDDDSHHVYTPTPTDLTSTPEPGSMALLATGLVGLGARFRRRRNTE